MARAARIALDLALVSLRTVRPVISKVWSAAKTKIISTPAKPLVSNPVVIKVESLLDRILATSKELKINLAIAWRYAKIELAPPMTISFLHGPAGQKLEGITSNAAESLITGLSNKIREMDAEEERQKQEKEAAIKKALEKAKAEEKKKADEKKKDAEKLAKDAKLAEKPKEETAGKNTDPPKKVTKDSKPK